MWEKQKLYNALLFHGYIKNTHTLFALEIFFKEAVSISYTYQQKKSKQKHGHTYYHLT